MRIYLKKLILVCIDRNKKINGFKLAKNQKLDVLAFCKQNNVYPELQIYYTELLDTLIDEENKKNY